MTEIVVALLMFLNGNMIEHTYKESMSSCLKSKRIAMREINPDSVVFSCKKISAKTEIYQGRKKILKVLEQNSSLSTSSSSSSSSGSSTSLSSGSSSSSSSLEGK